MLRFPLLRECRSSSLYKGRPSRLILKPHWLQWAFETSGCCHLHILCEGAMPSCVQQSLWAAQRGRCEDIENYKAVVKGKRKLKTPLKGNKHCPI